MLSNYQDSLIERLKNFKGRGERGGKGRTGRGRGRDRIVPCKSPNMLHITHITSITQNSKFLHTMNNDCYS